MADTNTSDTSTTATSTVATTDTATGAATLLGDPAATGDGGSKGEGDKAGDKPAADAKPDDAKAGDDKGADGKEGKEGDKPADKVVPEKYEFTLPEGMPMDEAAVAAFDPVFRELGLSNDQAQMLAGKFAEWRTEQDKAAGEAHIQQAETWAKQVKEDPEFGGQAFDTNVQLAQKAVAAFASPELKSLLETTGLGNHPELVKFCWRIGKSIGEDRVAGTGSPGGGERSTAERLYPSMNK